MHDGFPVQPAELVVADVEVDDLEARLHVVVVAQLLDGVAAQVQPQQTLGDEGVVEPLEAVERHVQPLQLVLRRQQPVQVLQPVVVYPESLQSVI